MTGLTDSPLSGRTILITRPRDDRNELVATLESNGAAVVYCPTIEITEPDSYDLLDAAINDLFGYDWIIFTSVNGVEYFSNRIKALGKSLDELDDVRVCAIGEATADRLRDEAVHVDVAPANSRAEGIFQALIDYVGGRDALATLNFLLPRAAVARDHLPLVLREAGARVDDVAVYRTVPPKISDLGRIRALLEGGGIDCVTFTSSSAVQNFATLFDVVDLRQLLGAITIACIGAVTADTAGEFGLEVQIRPRVAGLSELAQEITRFYEQ